VNIDQSKVNRNLMGEVSLPQCPRFREEAENIVAMLDTIPPFDYNSAGEFQKRIIVEYWLYYDNLEGVFAQYPNLHRRTVFKDWFMKATPPENIRRACQWLVSPESDNGGGIIELKPSIRESAVARAEVIRREIKSSEVKR
jgi:hypothetical protein